MGFHVGFIFVSSLTHGTCIQSVPCGRVKRAGRADLHDQKWVVGVDGTLWGWGFGESQDVAVVFETGSW